MSENAWDLTFVVVGADEHAVSETCASITRQQVLAPAVVCTTAEGLKGAVTGIRTEWVSILPQGAQLSPDWLDCLGRTAPCNRLGAVGGRTLELCGAQTNAVWFDAPSAIVSVDALGRCHSRLTDVPSRPMSAASLFLRWDNMICRTEFVQEALGTEDDVSKAVHAVVPCALAIRRGLDVTYDSQLRCARQLGEDVGRMASRGDVEWRRIASQQVFELAQLPSRFMALRVVVSSVIIGTRQLPGLPLGVAYVWSRPRRRRWWACVRGKVSGLLRVTRVGSK